MEFVDRWIRGIMQLRRIAPLCQFECGWETVAAIVAALQLALRHPGLTGHMRDRVRGVVDALISQVGAAAPDVAEMLRLGDGVMYDTLTRKERSRDAEEGHHPPPGDVLHQFRALVDRAATCTLGLDWRTALALAHCVSLSESDPGRTRQTAALGEHFARQVEARLRPTAPLIADCVALLLQYDFPK